MFNPCQNHHHLPPSLNPPPSLPPSVDTTPTCTRADARFSRAFITVHNSRIDGHTALAQGKRNLCCAFLCTRFHFFCHVLVRWSSWSLPSCHVFTNLLFVKTLSVLNLVWWKWSKLCASAHWSGMSGCLANPAPKHQVMSPTSAATWTRSTRR